MNHLNNHFQKGIIILVIAILIISSMHTYSSVGSYQTVSSWAIKANENHELQKILPKKSYLLFTAPALAFELFTSLAILAVGVVLASGLTTPNDKPVFNKNYEKYDFSQFDN